MRTRRTRLAAAGLLSLLTAATGAEPVHLGTVAAGASVFRVNTTTDKGDNDLGDGICDTTASASTTRCSLRAAIQNANLAPDQSEIRFNRRRPARARSRPSSRQPAAHHHRAADHRRLHPAGLRAQHDLARHQRRALKIELDGRFITAAGLTATAPVTITGLSIYWFGRGIQLSAGSEGSEIMGSFIGTDATGTQDRGNDSSGIRAERGAVRAHRLGGACGSQPISGNTSSGINLGIAAHSATIQGNLIGTSKNARKALSNEGDGVFVTGSDDLIGGTFAGQGNVIAFNEGDGVNLINVTLSGDTLVPTGVRISLNSIFRNGGQGIDLDDDGLTPNDAVPDKDSGPNGLQNFPQGPLRGPRRPTARSGIRGSLASRRDHRVRGSSCSRARQAIRRARWSWHRSP